MDMLWAGSLTRIRGKNIGVLGGNLKERNDLKKLDIDGSITLNGISNRLKSRGLDLSESR
jgi:hypothetical protein